MNFKMMMMVGILRCMVCTLLFGSAGLVALVHSEDQAGFISIDCGLSDESDYIDSSTKIHYTSDTEFTTTGTNNIIARAYQTNIRERQLATVRSFPEGTRNCYTLTPQNGTGTNYLIRASFMYGNYDSINEPPTFDLHIGVDVWDTIKLDNSSHVVDKELIHTPLTEYLDVCLVNTGDGTPFMSTLELRALNSTIYNRRAGSLDLVDRFYADSTPGSRIRYSDDEYDRIWISNKLPDGTTITTLIPVDTSRSSYKLPPAAMNAAMTPTDSSSKSLELTWIRQNQTGQYYVFMHFAELQRFRSNETREFNVMFNGSPFVTEPVKPLYLIPNTVSSTEPVSDSTLRFTLTSTETSNFPPIINAIELYMVRELSQQKTIQVDAVAMKDIKSTYDVTKNWQGDPCSPVAYRWSGVNCSYDSLTATITSLNLSSSGLKGQIASSISNLTSLEVLDLSNNDLTGEIPEFLADLIYLKILYLGGNKFTGSVPQALIEKSKKGLLDLRLESSPHPCQGVSCQKKLIIIIVASIAAMVVIFAIVIGIVCLKKREKKKQSGGATQSEREIDQTPVHAKRKGGLSCFTHSEVTEMTEGFKKQLGKGAYGTVYYGHLKDGTEVAVKMLQQSIQGSEQFETEVELLMAIHHKNLVSLIGYCDEENKLALIYEYMAKCDLQCLIQGSDLLSWKQRIQIAIDSAQGLDYLHNGCRPPVVHRDVKTSNILLNENMHAKVADFGLSKMFPDEFKSYMTTRVIGTSGYVDPEYHITEQLNEKSDVYSFGVVLLELITGKPAVIRSNHERTNLVRWVIPRLDGGDIWSIVDQRLQDIENPLSIWKIVDIAMACVKPMSNERPTMSQIVIELKECLSLEMEMAKQGNSSSTSIGPNDSINMNPVMTATGPRAR